MSAYSVGAYGERLAISEFSRAGYDVSKLRDKCQGDLVIYDEFNNRVTVEVKTSCINADGRYKATLEKFWQGRRCASFSADYLLLILLLPSGIAVYFLVPDYAVGSRRQVSVTNPFSMRSWLSTWRVKSATLEIPHIQFFVRSNTSSLKDLP